MAKKKKNKKKNLGETKVICFYVEVGNIDDCNVMSYLKKYKKSVKMDYKDVKTIFIPVRNTSSRIEMINY